MTPFPVLSDFYTCTSNPFESSEARELSVYNFTNRISPKDALPSICKDSRMVFYGLSYFIRNHLNNRISKEEVAQSAEFFRQANSFGGSVPFDKDLWMAVVDDCGGFLPIKIEAMDEGSVFFPNEPVVQVRNTKPGFGNLAAFIEPLLVGAVSKASAFTTVCKHWYEWFVEVYQSEGLSEDEAREVARFSIHNFGMRASSVYEESLLFGLSHLLVFNGTDNTHAAFQAVKEGAEHPIGTSIPALAHRIVQGFSDENMCFEELSNNGGKIASYVGDCYNWENALENLSELAKRKSDKIVVARPDSGDYVQTVLDVCRARKKHNLINLRFIQGDSMNPEKVKKMVDAIHEEGYNLHECGIFGVGGWLVNTCTRDFLSSAYKLSAISSGPVCKLSEIPEKMSVPGPNCIRRDSYEYSVGFESEGNFCFQNSYLQTHYENGNFNFETFPCIRTELDSSWRLSTDIVERNPNYGINPLPFSLQVSKFRKEVYDKHKS